MKLSTWLVLSSVVETICFVWTATTASGVSLILSATVVAINLMITWFFFRKDSESLV